MKTKFLAPFLAATFALAVVACDDAQNEASTDTSTGQSGGSAPNTVGGTGTTSNAGRTTGTSGTPAWAAIRAAPVLSSLTSKERAIVASGKMPTTSPACR